MKKTYLAACTAALLALGTGWVQASPVDNPDDPAYVVKTVQADNTKARSEAPKQAELAQAASKVTLPTQMVDRHAIPEAQSLYRYLAVLPETGRVLYGHQNDAHHKMFRIQSGTESDTKDMTGSLSGIVGVDALSLTGDELHPREAAKVPGDTLMDKLTNLSVKAVDEGAILTLSMHMPNFAVVAKKPKVNGHYDFQGYTAGTTTGDVVKRILPGGDLAPVFTDYLDMVADYALRLQAKNIPVIFRPLHEHNGSWFWWGGKNTNDENFTALWQFTVKYLRDTKGVHNFIYAYSPNGPFDSGASYLDRYPGDRYVDILSVDSYQDNRDYAYFSKLQQTLDVMHEVAKQNHKVVALTEVGVRDGGGLALQHNADKDWFTHVMQLCLKNKVPYFLTWANFEKEAHNFFEQYMTSDTKGHEMVDNFVRFYNEPASTFADGTGDYRHIFSK